MHRLEEDRQYRPLSEAVSFNKARDEVHGLAMYLEKCGFETYGVNTDLYAVINVGKHKYTIYPSYLSFNNKILCYIKIYIKINIKRLINICSYTFYITISYIFDNILYNILKIESRFQK